MTDELLFYYERTRRQQAAVLAFNMLFLPVVLGLLLLLVDDPAAYRKFVTVLQPLLIACELVMLGVLLWLLARPAAFTISLGRTLFSSHHPQFKAWCFAVHPQDIAEISYGNRRKGQSAIRIVLKDGQQLALCPNFAFSHRKLFAALQRANPAIRVPDPFWPFARRRGLWAGSQCRCAVKNPVLGHCLPRF
ncbi:hypothetical protein [Chitinilyticum piscinae]|uniref:Uncharacterized protein n=1 Tax=Chitinilyticum piscinae TaxID=2866724 RepID=A0A8J7KEQ3_9NEIS|nr:hypothetical protein [Chitinilyticum piscinae]MBE9609729.1 hypothetical protein [Chitinilyticum piscinae]